MGMLLNKVKTVNTIIYCKKWGKTVHFYRKHLRFSVNYSSDWFVEFEITPESRLSVADEKHSSIKSSGGSGITLTFEVEDIESTWNNLKRNKLKPTKIEIHPWNAKVFYIKDPEGHRIEVWQECG